MRIGSLNILSSYFRVVESNPNPGTTAGSIVGINTSRVALLIGYSGPTAARISTLSNVSSTLGFPLSSSLPPFSITFHDYPLLVQLQWFGILTGAGGPFSVIEVIEQDRGEGMTDDFGQAIS